MEMFTKFSYSVLSYNYGLENGLWSGLESMPNTSIQYVLATVFIDTLEVKASPYEINSEICLHAYMLVYIYMYAWHTLIHYVAGNC